MFHWPLGLSGLALLVAGVGFLGGGLDGAWVGKPLAVALLLVAGTTLVARLRGGPHTQPAVGLTTPRTAPRSRQVP